MQNPHEVISKADAAVTAFEKWQEAKWMLGGEYDVLRNAMRALRIALERPEKKFDGEQAAKVE